MLSPHRHREPQLPSVPESLPLPHLCPVLPCLFLSPHRLPRRRLYRIHVPCRTQRKCFLPLVKFPPLLPRPPEVRPPSPPSNPSTRSPQTREAMLCRSPTVRAGVSSSRCRMTPATYSRSALCTPDSASRHVPKTPAPSRGNSPSLSVTPTNQARPSCVATTLFPPIITPATPSASPSSRAVVTEPRWTARSILLPRNPLPLNNNSPLLAANSRSLVSPLASHRTPLVRQQLSPAEHPSANTHPHSLPQPQPTEQPKTRQTCE